MRPSISFKLVLKRDEISFVVGSRISGKFIVQGDHFPKRQRFNGEDALSHSKHIHTSEQPHNITNCL